MKIRSVRLILSAVAVMLLLVACADSTDTTPTTTPDAINGQSEFAFGRPAAVADADRIVEVVATDDLRFHPESVAVAEGETILFRVVNDGKVVHDFTLGDESAQQEHAEEMAEMGGMAMHDEPNAVALAAGETKELVWTFTYGGTFLFGCHQPGHYDAGMRGEVSVEG